MDRMDEMNRPTPMDYDKAEPIQSGEAKPLVAAAIVFSPIVVSVILLILYVLFSKR